MRFLIFGSFFLCILLTECATIDNSAPVFAMEKYIDEKDSVIYIYRVSGLSGAWVDLDVVINNEYYNRILINGYLVFHVIPGIYYIKCSKNGNTLYQKIEVEQNRNYYLRISGDAFKRIKENQALRELASTRKVVAKWERK